MYENLEIQRQCVAQNFDFKFQIQLWKNKIIRSNLNFRKNNETSNSNRHIENKTVSNRILGPGQTIKYCSSNRKCLSSNVWTFHHVTKHCWTSRVCWAKFLKTFFAWRISIVWQSLIVSSAPQNLNAHKISSTNTRTVKVWILCLIRSDTIAPLHEILL